MICEEVISCSSRLHKIMSSWEDIGSTYIEAATKAFPLHRAIVFFAGFLMSLSVQHRTHFSALETLAVIPLLELTMENEGFFAKSTVGNIIWALISTIAGIFLSKILIRVAYGIVDRATKATEQAKNLDGDWISSLSIEERKAALELVNSGMLEPRARLQTLTAINELLIGVGIVFSVAAFFGGALDFLVGGVAFVCAFFSHLFSIRIFLTDYYGVALAKAQLQGKPPPHMKKID